VIDRAGRLAWLALAAVLAVACGTGTPGATAAGGSPTHGLATAAPITPAATATAAASTPPETPEAVPSPTAVVPSSPVTGLIIAIERTGLTEVQGFTFRSDAGEEIPFLLGRLENEADFPPSHLAEHMAAGDVLEVYFRAEAGDLIAYRIEHAGDDEH
jgi:hypothetical protein